MPYTNGQEERLAIALGTDNFREMVTEYDIFVDKSLFIKKIIDNDAIATFITYPRRWGKTLNLDMLKTFLELEDERCLSQRGANNIMQSETSTLQCNREIFTGGPSTLASGEQKILSSLKISTVDSGKYMKYQGQYPVIFISLKDIVGNSLQEIQEKLKELITYTYEKYDYLTKSDKLLDSEKLRFKKYIEQTYQGISLEYSIKFLSELLHKHHGREVYVLVDEYDKPVNSLLEVYLGQNKTQEEEQLIRNIAKLVSQTVCSSVGKTNSHIKKLILTGIFDTTHKESGSGCNNLSVYGVSDRMFSTSFGFSEKEVETLVGQFPFVDKKSVLGKIKEWYNGYLIEVGDDEVMEAYTPWAVMKYLHTAYISGDFKPQSYWTQSGASTILQNLLKNEACSDSPLSNKLQNMLSVDTVSLEFDQHISMFQYDLNNAIKNEEIFSYLLLNSGYLTVRREGEQYMFSIPNFEVRKEFAKVIKKQIGDIKSSSACKGLLDNLYKKQHIEVIKFITSGDQKAIDGILKDVKCADSDLNFNYFQIAALSKDMGTTFEKLLSRCGGNITELLHAKDKVFGLNVKDYVQLGVGTLPSLFEQELGHISESLRTPTAKEHTLCNQLIWYGYNLAFTSIATGTVKFLSKKLTPAGVSNRELLDIFVATGIATTLVKDGFKIFDQYRVSYCSEYNAYDQINVESPKDFSTLKQFKKYDGLHHHQSGYVVLGEACGEGYRVLKSIVAPIFSNSFYGSDELTFTLCIPDNISLEIQNWD